MDDDDTAWADYLADALAWQAEWPEPVWPKCDEEMEPLGPIEWGDW